MLDEIVEILKNSASGLTVDQLLRRLSTELSHEEVQERVYELLDSNQIKKEKAGRYVFFEETFQVGKIFVKEGGFAFVNTEDDGPSVFIPPGRTANAISGEIVKVRITDPDDKRGAVGEVLEIVEGQINVLVGELVYQESLCYVKPLRAGAPEIHIEESDLEAYPGSKTGDWFRIEILERPLDKSKTTGHLVAKLGDGDDLSAELDAAISEFGLEPLYSEKEEKLAAKIKERPIKRVDLTKLCTVTVDPFDAKDYDDALSVYAKDEKTIDVAIHIADVAAYIAPGDDWYERVKARSFTAYLPGRMMPMLPKVLVTERCSLIEEEIRPAHTVIVKICRQTGEMLDTKRFHSNVKVAKRLDYEQVQNFAESKFADPNCDWTDEVKESVKDMYNLAKVMRRWRKKNERFIPLEAPEVRVLVDREMKITGLKTETPMFSKQMIEEYMLAANVAVAKEMMSREIAGVYRVHPEPNEDHLKEFADMVGSFYDLPVGDMTVRKTVVKFLKRLKTHESARIISYDFLRSMQRAIYSEIPQLHYGLGKLEYAHFTSPIRRFSDLLVHQQLWDLESGTTAKTTEACASEAVHISEKEQMIDEAYRTVSTRFKLHYVKQMMEKGDLDSLDTTVARVTKNGLKLWIDSIGHYGFVALRDFPDDYYMVDPTGKCVTGKRSGRVINCGDDLKVTVAKVDLLRRDLELVPFQETPKMIRASIARRQKTQQKKHGRKKK